MKNWTIGRRIIVGFGILIAIIAVMGTLIGQGVLDIRKNLKVVVQEAIPRVDLLMEFRSDTVSAHRALFRMAIADNTAEVPELAAKLADARATAETAWARYRKDFVVSGEAEEPLAKTSDLAWQTYEGQLDVALDLAQKGEFKEIQLMLRGGTLTQAFNRLYSSLQEEIAFNKTVTKQDTSACIAISERTLVVTLVCLGLAMGAAIGTAVIIVQGVTRSLRQIGDVLEISSDCLSNVASEVAGNSQNLADGASRQAASLEETSASLEEISSMTSRNVDGAGQAKETSTKTRDARRGRPRPDPRNAGGDGHGREFEP